MAAILERVRRTIQRSFPKVNKTLSWFVLVLFVVFPENTGALQWKLNEYKSFLISNEIVGPNSDPKGWIPFSPSNDNVLPDECPPSPPGTVVHFDYLSWNLILPERVIFCVFFCILGLLSSLANAYMMYIVFTRKNRLMLKCCLGSMAASDLINGVFSIMSNIANLSNETMQWMLGEVMCSAMPFMQGIGALANSLTLGLVAADRYHSLLAMRPGRREPSPRVCAVSLSIIWGLAVGISGPMATTYQVLTMLILMIDDRDMISSCVLLQRCYMVDDTHNVYFMVLFGFVFIPLLLAFLVLHGIIASFIWRKRRPVTYKSTNKCQIVPIRAGTTSDSNPVGGGDSSSSGKRPNTTSTIVSDINNQNSATEDKSGREDSKSKISTAACHTGNKVKSRQTERNIRSFKRIIAMMVIFFVLRLPLWIMNLDLFPASENPHGFYIVRYSFSLMNLLNCLLNPLLYCFFNETLALYQKFKGILRRILCMCYSHGQPDTASESEGNSNTVQEERVPRPMLMVPRGPCGEGDKHRTGQQ